MDSESIRARVASVPTWWHSIDVGGGVVPPGFKSAELLADELEKLRLPALAGKRVLDVGAWDGFFSFSCEERGAAEVVALDHHVWSIDLAAYDAYRKQRILKGEEVAAPETLPGMWNPDALPCKAGFDAAASLRGSRVTPVVGDLLETPAAEIGEFDVVLYLGVLYHMPDPFLALRKLVSVTLDLAVIETEAMVVPAYPEASLARFLPFGELNDDSTNWWVPTLPALTDMCLAAGFSKVEATVAPPEIEPPRKRLFGSEPPAPPLHYRLVVHARK